MSVCVCVCLCVCVCVSTCEVKVENWINRNTDNGFNNNLKKDFIRMCFFSVRISIRKLTYRSYIMQLEEKSTMVKLTLLIYFDEEYLCFIRWQYTLIPDMGINNYGLQNIYIYIYIYIYIERERERDSKFPQLSKILLSILTDRKNVLVW